MPRVRLVHWKKGEAEERSGEIVALGHHVDASSLDGSALKRLREAPPDAVVIDLSRLPAQGRDVAIAVRKYKATRHLPIVMVGGDPEKVEKFKSVVPDAVYSDWNDIGKSIERAIAEPPTDPLVPDSLMAGYAGAPLVKKLGIKSDFTVAILNSPSDFEEKLGDLPPGVTLKSSARSRQDLILWFATRLRDVERRIERLGGLTGSGGLWVIWPKKDSGVKTDLNQAIVRKAGMDRGLVDYKVARIDERWTGLRFARRK